MRAVVAEMTLERQRLCSHTREIPPHLVVGAYGWRRSSDHRSTYTMDADPTDDLTYTRFENKDEFVALRDQLLALDLYVEPSQEQAQSEAFISTKLSVIVWQPTSASLVEYQLTSESVQLLPGAVLPMGSISRGTRHSGGR